MIENDLLSEFYRANGWRSDQKKMSVDDFNPEIQNEKMHSNWFALTGYNFERLGNDDIQIFNQILSEIHDKPRKKLNQKDETILKTNSPLKLKKF